MRGLHSDVQGERTAGKVQFVRETNTALASTAHQPKGRATRGYVAYAFGADCPPSCDGCCSSTGLVGGSGGSRAGQHPSTHRAAFFSLRAVPAVIFPHTSTCPLSGSSVQRQMITAEPQIVLTCSAVIWMSPNPSCPSSISAGVVSVARETDNS